MNSVNIDFYETEFFLDDDRLTFEQQDECLLEAVAHSALSWPVLAFRAGIDACRFDAIMAREVRPTEDEFFCLSDALQVDLTRAQRWGYRSVEDIIHERRSRKFPVGNPRIVA